MATLRAWVWSPSNLELYTYTAYSAHVRSSITPSGHEIETRRLRVAWLALKRLIEGLTSVGPLGEVVWECHRSTDMIADVRSRI